MITGIITGEVPGQLSQSIGQLRHGLLPSREVVLGGNPESICHPVEEGEQSNDIHGLRNLLFFPSQVAKFLDVFTRRAVGRLSDQLGITEQRPLSGSQPRRLDLALEYSRNALISCSLNPQEVSMTIQSIRAAVQIGDVCGQHFLVPAGKMAFRKVHCI